MYEYYNNVLRRYFVEYDKVQIFYSDTDSFVLKIRSEDILLDFKNLSLNLTSQTYPLIINWLVQQRNIDRTILKQNLVCYQYYSLCPLSQTFTSF